MKSILERLIEDPELDKFYDLNDEEQKKFLNEILLFSNDNQQEIKNLCLKITPDFFSIHSIIFEALSEDWDKWGEFLTDEFIRIYKNAKKVSNSIDYCDCLSSICFPETDKIYTKKVIDFIIKDIDNSNDHLKNN